MCFNNLSSLISLCLHSVTFNRLTEKKKRRLKPLQIWLPSIPTDHLRNWSFPCCEQWADKQDSSAVRIPISSLTIPTSSCQPEGCHPASLAQCWWHCWAPLPRAAHSSWIHTHNLFLPPFTSQRFAPLRSNTSAELKRCSETQLQRTPVHFLLLLTCCRSRECIWVAEKVWTTKPMDAGGCISSLKLTAPSITQWHWLLLQFSYPRHLQLWQSGFHKAKNLRKPMAKAKPSLWKREARNQFLLGDISPKHRYHFLTKLVPKFGFEHFGP